MYIHILILKTPKHIKENKLMLQKHTQELLNHFVSGLRVIFVFKSNVHYDIYLPILNGVMKYDCGIFTWTPTEFKNQDDIINTFKDQYPIYSNAEISQNLDWFFNENVKSLSNVSLPL